MGKETDPNWDEFKWRSTTINLDEAKKRVEGIILHSDEYWKDEIVRLDKAMQFWDERGNSINSEEFEEVRDELMDQIIDWDKTEIIPNEVINMLRNLKELLKEAGGA